MNSAFRGSTGLYRGLLGVNTLIFGCWTYAQYYSDRPSDLRTMYRHYSLSTREFFRDHRYHTLLTATVSQKDLGHYLANIVTLYFFGRDAAIALSPRQFAALYFGSGVMGSAAFIGYHEYRKRNNGILSNSYALGSSGSIYGLLAWSIFTHPTRTIHFFGVVPLQAWMLGVALIGIDVYSLQQPNHTTEDDSEIIHGVGMAYGMLFYLMRKTSMFLR